MPTATPTAIDPRKIAQTAIKNLTQLSTLPEVTTRIIAAVENPRSSAGQLHKIISYDPALVTRILKIVNSAFYGLPGQVGSVERAIVLLGLNAVKNMAVAASLGQLFRRVTLYDGADAKDLWRHCVSVAIVARELAIKAKLPVGDEAFLAGMIHDTGILVELQSWPEQLRSICQTVASGDADFCQTEQSKLGVDHQFLGRALAEHWKFPKTCQEVAGCHHNPAEADPSAATLVRLIHAADTICCQKGEGFCLTARHQQLDATSLQMMGITQEMIDTTTADLAQKVSTAMSDLG